jgi:hypothetical protein
MNNIDFKFSSLISALIILVAVGCGPRGRFLQSSEYNKMDDLNKVYLAVVGSEKTNQCFRYLMNYLDDSLSQRGLIIERNFYCCRNEDTDMKQVMSELIPSDVSADHILAVVITRDVVGYGATSSRQLVVNLYNTKYRELNWSGKVNINFEWFISDKNYEDVAKKINQLIIDELTKKGILRA